MHWLVAFAYHPADFAPGLVVNHVNGVRDDNRAENLCWVTQAENMQASLGLSVTNQNAGGKVVCCYPSMSAAVLAEPALKHVHLVP